METTNNQVSVITENQLISYLDTMGLAQQLTDKEKKQFLEISKAYGLNPFKREIYCSKYNGQMTIITGYETYIKRAERSGLLDGWQVITEGKVEDNTLKAIITIHRKDRKIPFVHEVYYSEYVQKTGAGAVNKFWQKSYTMTKKVAMAQGFRLCFNDELGGMPYTSEEMPDNKPETVDTVSTVIEEPKQIESVVLMSAEDIEKNAIEFLNTAISITDLQEKWQTMAKEEKENPNVIKTKDELKTKLK